MIDVFCDTLNDSRIRDMSELSWNDHFIDIIFRGDDLREKECENQHQIYVTAQGEKDGAHFRRRSHGTVFVAGGVILVHSIF